MTFAPNFVFTVVNGGTVVDTSRIFTQFLILMSWEKKTFCESTIVLNSLKFFLWKFF
jgi:hypothetical protein